MPEKQTTWPVKKVRTNDVESYEQVSLSNLRETIKAAREKNDERPAGLLDSWVIEYVVNSINSSTRIAAGSKVKKVVISHKE